MIYYFDTSLGSLTREQIKNRLSHWVLKIEELTRDVTNFIPPPNGNSQGIYRLLSSEKSKSKKELNAIKILETRS